MNHDKIQWANECVCDVVVLCTNNATKISQQNIEIEQRAKKMKEPQSLNHAQRDVCMHIRKYDTGQVLTLPIQHIHAPRESNSILWVCTTTLSRKQMIRKKSHKCFYQPHIQLLSVVRLLFLILIFASSASPCFLHVHSFNVSQCAVISVAYLTAFNDSVYCDFVAVGVIVIIIVIAASIKLTTKD